MLDEEEYGNDFSGEIEELEEDQKCDAALVPG